MFRILWCTNYYDYPTSGIGIYNDEKVYFNYVKGSKEYTKFCPENRDFWSNILPDTGYQEIDEFLGVHRQKAITYGDLLLNARDNNEVFAKLINEYIDFDIFILKSITDILKKYNICTDVDEMEVVHLGDDTIDVDMGDLFYEHRCRYDLFRLSPEVLQEFEYNRSSISGRNIPYQRNFPPPSFGEKTTNGYEFLVQIKVMDNEVLSGKNQEPRECKVCT